VAAHVPLVSDSAPWAEALTRLVAPARIGTTRTATSRTAAAATVLRELRAARWLFTCGPTIDWWRRRFAAAR
jgi:hypothetical protein